jgi:hypothetical protein
LNSISDTVQTARHARLQYLHQTLPKSVRAYQKALLPAEPSLGFEPPGVFSTKELLLPLQDRTGDVPRLVLVSSERPEHASRTSAGRCFADHADVAEMEGIPFTTDDLRSELGSHEVHFGHDADGPRAERVDPPARSKCGRVGQIDVRGTNGEDDVWLPNILVAQGRDLVLELLRLVH